MAGTLLRRRLSFVVATLLMTHAVASMSTEASNSTSASSTERPASAPASAASAAPSSSVAGPAASPPASTAPECPSADEVFKRVLEAAKLNAAEASVVGGGVASGAAEVASNLLGFRSLFSAASMAAQLSAHKKIADAIAADPCGERALDAFPKPYRALFEAYQKEQKKK